MSKLINGVLLTEEECFLEHQKLIGSIIRRYLPLLAKLGVDKEELFSEGSIGLIKAYRNFDESYGYKFSTYAIPSIRGHIQRFMRDKSKSVKFSRPILDLANQITKEGLEEHPVSEIAKKLSTTEQKVEFALLSKISTRSMSEKIYQTENEKTTLGDLLGEEADYSEIHVKEFLDHLNETDRKIVEMKLQDCNQQTIGEELGFSQVHISRKLIAIGKQYKEFSEGEKMPKGNVEEAKRLLKETDLTVPQVIKQTGINDGVGYYHAKQIRKEQPNQTAPTIAREKYETLLAEHKELQEALKLTRAELATERALVKKQAEEIKESQVVSEWEEKYLQEKEAHEQLFKYMSLVKGA
ncbi:sigma-70 family RNA polymerase sigma factor [Virgibacillus salexigens]|uniref:sigma-70 family RNA polymerase sigma factor n=1 Tax=Virgibacillus salexigens TaxID=61016 RepID=UPI00190B4EF4|nr:sigma-70 family RNA polymerase sigma factor [Virgibacillus salexigens]